MPSRSQAYLHCMAEIAALLSKYLVLNSRSNASLTEPIGPDPATAYSEKPTNPTTPTSASPPCVTLFLSPEFGLISDVLALAAAAVVGVDFLKVVLPCVEVGLGVELAMLAIVLLATASWLVWLEATVENAACSLLAVLEAGVSPKSRVSLVAAVAVGAGLRKESKLVVAAASAPVVADSLVVSSSVEEEEDEVEPESPLM